VMCEFPREREYMGTKVEVVNSFKKRFGIGVVGSERDLLGGREGDREVQELVVDCTAEFVWRETEEGESRCGGQKLAIGRRDVVFVDGG
jgi:hypothetical protein